MEKVQILACPVGFQTSGDAYTKHFDDITVDMPHKTRIIDDTILWGSSIASSFWHMVEYISYCAQNGIIFNPDKFMFGKDEVDFGGFTITEDRVKPTSDMIDAIANFLIPTDITGIHSWLCLFNHVGNSFAKADIMAPFREPLSSKNKNSTETAL